MESMFGPSKFSEQHKNDTIVFFAGPANFLILQSMDI